MATKNESGKKDLVQTKSGTLSKQVNLMTIGALEAGLLKKYPKEDAESWDRTGLLVGDPTALISGVAIALDICVETIEQAKAIGANVLISHHPAFLDAPDSFGPAESVIQNPGAVVWAAIENSVALMCFHTALDVSKEAARILPGMLKLQLKGILQPLERSKHKGFGQLSSVKADEVGLSLAQLSARCTSVFGRAPRVWGDFDKKLSRIATCPGSASDLVKNCLEAGADCLVCGEIKYHDALAASQAGLAIIDLGHDTSELPLVAILANSVESLGVAKDAVMIIEQKSNWAYPESTRV